ncbi:hypothetical protein [Streptococcus oricebi]|uniref:Uncharacterized protein n=1 Tax=Streptococcus oricebi TaxID=1547447 RepID=A0ABS5B4P6_9STRE|nr:hypothetical protein [Streptococcus oricebi]MBP2622954.1 hypothetical protein [Streptococcus oricebi]
MKYGILLLILFIIILVYTVCEIIVEEDKERNNFLIKSFVVSFFFLFLPALAISYIEYTTNDIGDIFLSIIYYFMYCSMFFLLKIAWQIRKFFSKKNQNKYFKKEDNDKEPSNSSKIDTGLRKILTGSIAITVIFFLFIFYGNNIRDILSLVSFIFGAMFDKIIALLKGPKDVEDKISDELNYTFEHFAPLFFYIMAVSIFFISIIYKPLLYYLLEQKFIVLVQLVQYKIFLTIILFLICFYVVLFGLAILSKKKTENKKAKINNSLKKKIDEILKSLCKNFYILVPYMLLFLILFQSFFIRETKDYSKGISKFKEVVNSSTVKQKMSDITSISVQDIKVYPRVEKNTYLLVVVPKKVKYIEQGKSQELADYLLQIERATFINNSLPLLKIVAHRDYPNDKVLETLYERNIDIQEGESEMMPYRAE